MSINSDTQDNAAASSNAANAYTQPVLAVKDQSGYLPENQRKHSPVGEWQGQSYYHYPPIKKPHWNWLVALYFWVGGIAAGCQILATLVEWFGRRQDRQIVRAGRYLSLLGMLIAPLLLILDLGRPQRFLNMLRIFKPTSVMSLGSWGISAFGASTGLLAARQAVDDDILPHHLLLSKLLRLLPKRLLSALTLPLAFFVGSYTAVLLAATNVPLWAKSKLALGPLFLGSAMSTGTAAVTLVLAATDAAPESTLCRLESYDAMALFTELVNVSAAGVLLGPLAKPALTGQQAPLFGVALGAGVALPMLVQVTALVSRRTSRTSAILTSLLVLGGGLILRYAILQAGKASADDPQQYFQYTQRR